MWYSILNGEGVSTTLFKFWSHNVFEVRMWPWLCLLAPKGEFNSLALTYRPGSDLKMRFREY